MAFNYAYKKKLGKNECFVFSVNTHRAEKKTIDFFLRNFFGKATNEIEWKQLGWQKNDDDDDDDFPLALNISSFLDNVNWRIKWFIIEKNLFIFFLHHSKISSISTPPPPPHYHHFIQSIQFSIFYLNTHLILIYPKNNMVFLCLKVIVL